MEAVSYLRNCFVWQFFFIQLESVFQRYEWGGTINYKCRHKWRIIARVKKIAWLLSNVITMTFVHMSAGFKTAHSKDAAIGTTVNSWEWKRIDKINCTSHTMIFYKFERTLFFQNYWISLGYLNIWVLSFCIFLYIFS
jgi:hypothetical protein